MAIFCRANLGLLASVLCVMPTFARKTNLTENQKGFVLGIGQYFNPLFKAQHEHEPASQWRGDYQTLIRLEETSIRPIKFGMFWSSADSNFEFYTRLTYNTRKPWSSVTNPAGQGRSVYKGTGAGLLLGIRLLGDTRWRLLLNAQTEYIYYKARLEFRPDGDATEIINLRANTYTAGSALSWEYWFADMWVLSVLGGYLHAFPATWSVKEEGTKFFGLVRAAGLARDRNGHALNARFGGFYLEGNLKLNFFTL